MIQNPTASPTQAPIAQPPTPGFYEHATAYEQVTRVRLEHVERAVDRLESKINAVLIGIIFTVGAQIVSLLLNK